MFARESSARGQMRSPSIAQRGEGGARGGSGEFSPAVGSRTGCSGLPRPAGRGLPGGNSLFFVSPKKSKQKKGDPAVCVPPSLTLRRATCGARQKRGLARTRFAQTIASPDPLLPALLGAYRRVGKRKTNSNTDTELPPEFLKRVALQERESPQTVMFARESSARGHMKSPSLAQRGEGGARGGSGELAPATQANRRPWRLPTRGALAKFSAFSAPVPSPPPPPAAPRPPAPAQSPGPGSARPAPARTPAPRS